MSLWDRKARFYAFARRLYPLRLILDAENAAVRELLQSAAISESAALLDLGCGYGNAAGQLPAVDRLILLDRSLSMLRQARSHLGAPAVVADACALPFREGTFSLVSAVGLLEYLPDPGGCAAEISRVISPRGYLVVTIAPKTWPNRFRRLLGARLHWHRPEALEEELVRVGLGRQRTARTWLQQQFLYQRRDAR
jgi:ubiquinone/menaquinone biosynthesis C-methylase UbiE